MPSTIVILGTNLKESIMNGWHFTFEGKRGFVEPYKGGAFILWGGMGFHITAASPKMKLAMLRAKPQR